MIERVEQFPGRHLGVQRSQRLDDGRARHLAGGVTSHPVGDRKQPGPSIDRVLIVLAVQADIGLHRTADGKLALSIRHDSVLSGQIADEEGSELTPGRGLRLDLSPVRGQF